MKKPGSLHREGVKPPGVVGSSTSGTVGSQASLRAVALGSDEGINWEPLIGFHRTSQGCSYRLPKETNLIKFSIKFKSQNANTNNICWANTLGTFYPGFSRTTCPFMFWVS